MPKVAPPCLGLFVSLVVLSGCSSTPTSSPPDTVRPALVALKKLQSATGLETGLSYNEYGRRVIDTKVEFDAAIASVPTDNPLRSRLVEVMDVYTTANVYWGVLAAQAEKNGGVWQKTFRGAERDRYTKYGVKFHTDQNTQPGNGVGLRDGVGQMWAFASEKIAAIEKQLEK